MLDPGVAQAQLDARDNPRVSGPLRHTGGSCEADRERFGGQVVALSRSCGDVYGFDPDRENDANRNYDVIWIQSYVDARNGFCATKVRSILTVPRGTRIERKAPRYERTDEKIRFRTRLVAKAGGTAERNGVVRQGFALRPRVLDPSLDGRTFVVEWRGNSAAPLAFALGVEVSYPANNPPGAQPHGSVRSELRSC